MSGTNLKYSEISADDDSVIVSNHHARKLRKMSCFEVRTDDFDCVRYTKKNYSTNSLPLPTKKIQYKEPSFEFEILRWVPQEVAAQLTLIDFELFSKIEIEELSSIGWTKKEKHQVSPNVVNYTKRFNHVSYWVVEEVLKPVSSVGRAEVITYFLRVAKHLYEYNNLHSLFAIISALRSASLFRLSCTWSFVPKKEKNLMEKFVELFSDKDNWSKFRIHMDSLKFPCVPYIGVYLTDLVYLSTSKGTCFLEQNLSANNIFRIISTSQTESDYSNLPINSPLQSKLRSIIYIDELLKFNEDYNYNTSLKLEPPNTMESPQKLTWLKYIWLKCKGSRLIA